MAQYLRKVIFCVSSVRIYKQLIITDSGIGTGLIGIAPGKVNALYRYLQGYLRVSGELLAIGGYRTKTRNIRNQMN
jgi:hypothetical protein